MKLKRNNYKLNLTGAFYTGFFVDTTKMIELGYIRLQNLLINALNVGNSKNWFSEISISEVDDEIAWTTQYLSVFAGKTIIPSSLVARNINFEKNMKINGLNFIFEKITLYIHDFGTGVYNLQFTVLVENDIEMRYYKKAIDDLGDQLNPLVNPILTETCTSLKNQFDILHIPVNYYTEDLLHLSAKGLNHIQTEVGLWYHKIMTFSFTDKTNEDLFEPVLSSSQFEKPKNASMSQDYRVFPGVGYTVFLPKIETKKIQMDTPRALNLSHYHYAAIKLLDAILFDKFVDYFGTVENITIAKIEEEIKQIEFLGERLDMFMVLIKDTKINLTPQANLVNENLWLEWHFPPMIEGVMDKNLLLKEKTSELHKKMEKQRSATLNRFVKIFTIFAVLGPLLEFYTIASENELFKSIFEINQNILIAIALSLIVVITILIRSFLASYNKF